MVFSIYEKGWCNTPPIWIDSFDDFETAKYNLDIILKYQTTYDDPSGRYYIQEEPENLPFYENADLLCYRYEQ